MSESGADGLSQEVRVEEVDTAIDADKPNWEVGVEGFKGYAYQEEGYAFRTAVGSKIFETTEDASTAANQITQILAEPFPNGISRTLVRVVLTADVLKNLPEEVLATMESLIDLRYCGNPQLRGCFQAIFARNAQERQTTQAEIANERNKVSRIFSETPPLTDIRTPLPLPKDWKIQQLANDHKDLVEQYKALLDESDLEEEVDKLIADHETQIIVLTDEKGTVRGGMYAWRDKTELTRGNATLTLHAWEVEGIVVPTPDSTQSTRQDVYAAMSQELMRLLANSSLPVDMVFEFVDLEDRDALHAAARLRKIPTQDVAEELGLHSVRGVAVGQDFTPGESDEPDERHDYLVVSMSGNQLRNLFGAPPPVNTSGMTGGISPW